MSEPTRQSANQGNKVQGEGDYDAAHRYRDQVTDFVNKSDVSKLAEQAEPTSTKEERELTAADERGRARSKGDDPADAGIMHTRQNRADAGKTGS